MDVLKKLNLDLESFDTVPSAFGKYVKIAQNGEAKVFLNVTVGPLGNNPKVAIDSHNLPVAMGVAVRMRLYGEEGSDPAVNPFPGFTIAKCTTCYWKVKVLRQVSGLELGVSGFVKRYKDEVVVQLIGALNAALDKTKGKFTFRMDDEALRAVLEQVVEKLPGPEDSKVTYEPIEFYQPK